MAKKVRTLILLLIVAVIVGLAITYITRPQPIPVILQDVATGAVESTVANTRAGTVNACQRARLSLSTGGQIAQLPVKEGDTVSAQQILLELWNADLQAELRVAEKSQVAATARVAEACALAEVAERESKRLTKLGAQGSVSQDRVDQTAGEARARRGACRAAKANVQVSEARIDGANAALERTRLRAPFAGTIAEINGELGEFVTPSPIGVATLPAVDLVDNSCLYVSAPIDEVDAPAVKTGMPARISLDAFPDKHFPGKVRRVAPYVLDREKQSRTVDTEVEFVHSEEIAGLLPGYSADAEIILAIRDNVLRIPTEAILEGNSVFVYDKADGRLHKREITTGLSNWQWTEVVSGLSADQQIVISVDREGVQDEAHAEPDTTTKR